MANRHLLRSIALQSLYEWDFSALPDEKMDRILVDNMLEFAHDDSASSAKFVQVIVDGVVENIGDINNVIEKAAPDWPLEKISIVDRNILRIGLFELLFGSRDEVPPKVAINEAIELAKEFGGDSSGRFVNGVLGAVYKEIGEPGKDQTSKKKVGKFNRPFEDMPIKNLCGAVVYAIDENELYLAFVHDVFGHWTLSKGKAEESDKDMHAVAIREIKEELGVDLVIEEELGQNEYIATSPEEGKIRKQVHYFLGQAPYRELTLGPSGGLDDARWFKVSELDLEELNLYEDIVPIVTKALQTLPEKITATHDNQS